MSDVKVTDMRQAAHAQEGSQAQAVACAHAARLDIEGCNVTVLFAFIPMPDGKHRVEVGIAGMGPAGMGEVVRDTLRESAQAIGYAMDNQERLTNASGGSA